ncbi:hypothetical protein GUITHDRAFT_164518 [Guillardia theta CCMP2712]|uniref:BZIP domain-containing protein n=2 Tax=Guillardia theta TaxID=55529 RepID=L1IYR6_GUITC|nr:hypothetical protein GUITHDRAFT_164518 [Guillardia theta CCMP2712]EKX40970.1 hypothetical protein GUITHDRAFT_164518 [Guillardia theta CCMP2712]|eukprot:XP_005827950.1 hypothetical protein GUITHDRAFT_164518 [Guillardia theta CCMP2712]
MQIFLKSAKTVTTLVSPHTSILHLKTFLTDISRVPSRSLRISCGGKELVDHKYLVDYGVKDGQTLEWTIRLLGGRGDIAELSTEFSLEDYDLEGCLEQEMVAVDECSGWFGSSESTEESPTDSAEEMIEPPEMIAGVDEGFDINKVLAAAAARDPSMESIVLEILPNGENVPISVSKTKKGLRYDLESIEDERLRKRLAKNRLSAEKSRQRRKNQLQELEQRLAMFEEQNLMLLKKNEALEQENANLRNRLGDGMGL